MTYPTPASTFYKDLYEIKCKEELRIKSQGEGLLALLVALTNFPTLEMVRVTEFLHNSEKEHHTPPGRTCMDGMMPVSVALPRCLTSEEIWDQALSPYHSFITVVRAL